MNDDLLACDTRKSLGRQLRESLASVSRVVLAMACAWTGTVPASEPGAPPNIVWIIAEDMSPDLGCYGDPLVRSPALDKLASEGTRYTNAFTTSPVCSASRSALITGMHQTTIGAHHHRSHRADGYRLPEGVRIVTEYFRRAGYYTANVTRPAPGLRASGKNDFNFQVDDPFDGTDWNQRRAGQPFFAQVNFSEVHRPYRKAKNNPVDPDRVVPPPCYPNHPVTRDDWARYLDTIRSLDAKVSAVLGRLDEEGLRANTAVFFFSDHGAGHLRGKHSLYDGGIRVPLIIRWPGRVEPGTVSDRLISAIDVTATSLALAGIEVPPKMEGHPFLDPSGPLESGSEPRELIVAARDRIDEAPDRIRAVRTKRYKYIRNYFPHRPYPTQWLPYKDRAWPVLGLMRQLQREGKLTPQQGAFLAGQWPPEEFYDLEQDPHELNNLIDSPRHQPIVADLRAKLDAWIEETGDQGAIPEDPEVVEHWRQWMIDRFEKGDRSKPAGGSSDKARSAVKK